MKIGVFDSGVGGLSVLKSLLEARLFDEIIYYGDTARVPYGTKDKDTIIRFSLEAWDFFKAHHIDMLIIACNTASAYALDALRAKIDIPVYGVIDAGVKATMNYLKNKDDKILVIATKATINSKQYQERLFKLGFTKVEALATPLFVPMVEEGIFEGELVESAFKHYFKTISYTPDALILACTHFPLLENALQKYFGKQTKLIHSGHAIVEYLKANKQIQSLAHKTKLEFYATSDVNALKETAKLWIKDIKI